MAEKLKNVLGVVGVSLVTAYAVKHINIDWGFIGNLVFYPFGLVQRFISALAFFVCINSPHIEYRYTKPLWTKHKIKTKEICGMWETLRLQEVRKTLKTNLEYGLNEQEAKIRLNQYGENKLDEKKKESLILRFIKQFNDFMIIILIIASIISAIVAKLEGSNDYMDSIIIIAIVIFNAIMGLLQEAKAEKSIEALKKMTSPTAKVKRDGKVVQVESSKVVPGDIVILEAGCFVPADCRLFKSYNLKVEESSLTGETNAVLKDADVILKPNAPIGDMVNMVFATTIVTNGHAEAIVTETGMNTKLGKIAKMIITDEAPETPLQKKLGQVGKTLGINWTN